MDYTIVAATMPAQPLAAVRRTARIDQLSTIVPQACGEVWDAVRAAGVANAGRLVAVYLDGAIHLEVGVEVSEEVRSDRVFASSTPAGLAARATHFGPYDRLGNAHDAITRWCGVQGYELAGPRWEVYGHWDDDPAKLRTDVYALLTSPNRTPG